MAAFKWNLEFKTLRSRSKKIKVFIVIFNAFCLFILFRVFYFFADAKELLSYISVIHSLTMVVLV